MKQLIRVARFGARLASALAATPRVRFVSGPSGREIVSVLSRLLTARGLVQGPAIDAYERDWQMFLPVAHAVSLGSGRLCLYAILRGLGVGPGDEVIVPGYTCVVVANAFKNAGIQPVYADIELETVRVREKRLMLADGFAFVVEERPAVPHPAWTNVIRRHQLLAIRADNDFPVGIARGCCSRLWGVPSKRRRASPAS